MKKALALAGLICVVASLSAGSLSAAPKARKFAPHQEPRGIGNLVARGDRVRLDYDAGVESATGFAYVRNDLRRRFVSLPLVAERGPATTYRARVPARLIRGHRLLYYAILRDPRTHRRARVPAQGTSSALILEQPRLVDSARIASARRGRRTRSWLVRARIRSAGNFRRRGRGPQQGPSRSSSGRITRSCCTTASTTACSSGTPAIPTRSSARFLFPSERPTTTSRSGQRARCT